MPNINKIKLSGTSYDIQDANATKTVELTQAQYDALVTGGTVDSNTFYIITDGEMFNPSGKVDTSAFTEFSGAVETELSGKTDESAFTAHTADTTIHVTTAQTAAWNAKSDFSGSYNDLTDKPTIPTVPTSNTAFTNDAGYITSNDITGKTDTTAFTAHTADTTIHVTAQDKTNWNAKSDFSGSYNDLTDKPTIPTVPTSNTAFTNDAGYITEDAISGKADSSAVTEEISAAVSGKVDTSTFNTYSGSVETALSGKQDTLSAGTNISIVDNVISAEGGGITSGEVQTMIDESISGKADYSAITESLATKVNVADNNVLAFSGVPLAINVNEDYNSLQLKTIYIKNNDVRQHTNVVFGVIMYYNGSYITNTNISGSSKSSSGITAITNTDTTAHTFTLENGVCRIDFLGSCHFSQLSSEGDGFSFYYIHNNNYTSGQSSTVIENTVYDALTELGKDIVDMNDSGRFVNVSKEQDITGQKNFIGDKGIKFSQKTSRNKPGFVIYAVNTANTTTEAATFEFRPNTFTIDGVQHPLMYFGHYRDNNTANAGVPQTVIGFRQYDQKDSAAYHYLLPLPEKAKTPFSLTTSFKDYYAPIGFKNGSTMITADNTGVVDFSDVLGGLKLVKLTQSEYDALSTKDSNTLYVITNS